MSADVKLVQYQIKPGEPYLFIRGDDKHALDVVMHYLSRLSIDQTTPVEKITRTAELANRMKDWKETKR